MEAEGHGEDRGVPADHRNKDTATTYISLADSKAVMLESYYSVCKWFPSTETSSDRKKK